VHEQDLADAEAMSGRGGLWSGQGFELGKQGFERPLTSLDRHHHGDCVESGLASSRFFRCPHDPES